MLLLWIFAVVIAVFWGSRHAQCNGFRVEPFSNYKMKLRTPQLIRALDKIIYTCNIHPGYLLTQDTSLLRTHYRDPY